MWRNRRPVDWTDGYVIDTPYIEPMHHDANPAHLSMVLALNGQPPLPTDRTLHWIELGCGTGMSACATAAGNPNVEVWGCDFNPAHVERARSLASLAELSNCSFDEASFDELAADDRMGPPEADVIVLHGIYAWVSPANRRHIAEIIRRRLRPGGIAYLMYNGLVGWADIVPIAEMMRLHAQASGLRSDLAFPGAARAVAQLVDGGARFFPVGPNEQRTLEVMPTADARYAVHEYLGAGFGPLMFDEVASAMAHARCSYVCSIEAPDHLTDFWVKPELTGVLDEIDDPVLRQMGRDLATQRGLRCDVFRRGLAVASEADRLEWRQGVTVVGLGIPLMPGAVAPVTAGEILLDHEFCAPLVDALAVAPLGVGGVRAIHPVTAVYDAATALSLLVGAGLAAPLVAGWPESGAADSARRFNEVLLAECRHGALHSSLISPATGGPIQMGYVEALTVGAVWAGMADDAAGVVAHVLGVLDTNDRRVMVDGALVTDPDEARRIVGERVASILARIQQSGHLLGW